jgi:hypothetical protein
MKSISASAVNCYHSCPRKFYLQYILHLKSPLEAPWLKLGSDVHAKLAKNIFESEDPVEHGMLQNGKKFLDSMPPNPIRETTYEDKSNPGRFFGEIFGQKAVGIFDTHWPVEAIGGDYKSGSFYKTYVDHFDYQAWILNELFKQKYDKPLKEFYFPFLKTGTIYEPPCIKDEKAGKKVERAIKKILFNMEEGNYEKNCGNLCSMCDLSMFCPMEL